MARIFSPTSSTEPTMKGIPAEGEVLLPQLADGRQALANRRSAVGVEADPSVQCLLGLVRGLLGGVGEVDPDRAGDDPVVLRIAPGCPQRRDVDVVRWSQAH